MPKCTCYRFIKALKYLQRKPLAISFAPGQGEKKEACKTLQKPFAKHQYS